MGEFTNLLKKGFTQSIPKKPLGHLGVKDLPEIRSQLLSQVSAKDSNVDLGATTKIKGFEPSEESKKRALLEKLQKGKSSGKFFTGVGNFARAVQVGLAQNLIGAPAQTLSSAITGRQETTSEELAQIGTVPKAIKEVIFGKDPIKSIQLRIAEKEIEQKKGGALFGLLTPEQLQQGKVAGIDPNTLLASSLVVGGIALDFWGGGGKKEATKILSKMNKVDDVAKFLKGLNVADDLIPTYAKIIANTSKVDDVAKALDKMIDIQKTTKPLVSKMVKPTKGIVRETTGQIKDIELKSLNKQLKIQEQASRKGAMAGKKEAIETLKSIQEERKFLASIKEGILKGLEGVKNKIRKQIGYERFTKELDGSIVSRIKEKNGIKEWSNATKEQLQSVLDDLRLLKKGDKSIAKAQVESLKEFGVTTTTTKREAVEILGDVASWKDKTKTRFSNFFKTIDQKITNTVGKDADRVKNILTRSREKAVTSMFKEEIGLKTKMKSVLNTLKVNNKKDRALIMRFGEGRISLIDLKKKTKNWEGIVNADKWFRKQYDTLLEATNKELSRFYPESKLIPKRKDYYTHSQELGSMWNLFKNKGGDISPILEQVSEFTKPNRKFNPFALKREGGVKFVEDAGKAFEAYLSPILHNKYMTESIVRHRAVADLLAHSTIKTKNINQFIFSLRDVADSLAGKTNPFDRALMNRVIGRKPIELITKLTQKMGKNRILGNVGSALMQISGIPNSVLRNNSIRTIKGLLSQAFSPLLGKNDPLIKSSFLLRRYGEKGLQHGETVFKTTLQKGEQVLAIPFELIEKNITKSIWRASFDNAFSQGFTGKELIQKADEITASIVGSRSIGEKAMAFESGVLSLPLQFQLEVNTHAQLWKEEVFSKMFKNPVKATATAIETSVTLFLMNSLFETTLGRTPLPDPIRAIDDASKSDNWIEGVGRIAGEGLSSVAGGQFFANLLPQDIKKKYFGRSEVGIYPGGIPIANSLQGGFKNPTNFVYDFVLPYGGGQLKKILQGVEGLDKMGSYDKSGKLQFPINQNQWLKVILFGKYSTPEAKEYFDKQRSSLSEKQTVEYFLRTQNGENPQEVYSDVAKDRIRGEYEKEIVKEIAKKIKSNPDEGLALLQLWKKQNIISNEMEKDIIDSLSK